MKLYKLIRKPPFFMSASHYMEKDDNPVKSGRKSRKAVIIPLILMQYGSMKDKIKASASIKPALVSSIKGMIKSAKRLKDNPKQGKTYIDRDTLDSLEKYASELGVSQIGYTKVNPDFIFKGFEILYYNAMVITMEMERKAIKSSSKKTATAEIWRTYAGLGDVVNKLADFLRDRGFNCHPSPALGGDVCTPPLAQDAGIGAIGKNGLLITPEFGPSHRIAAVFTDIENLPIKTIEENQHLWVKCFCDICNVCVKHCPGEAIYKETRTLSDGYPEYIDREKCAPHFSKNCCVCITVCPFINGNYSKMKLAFEKQQGDDE